jgi:putative flippase GtrA
MLNQRRQFVYFIAAGGIAAAVNFLSRIAINTWMPYSIAIVLAYLLGMLTAFVLNRAFVFREATNPIHHQAIWFTIINLFAVLQTLGVSLLLAREIFPLLGFGWHRELVAHAIGVATPIITSYIGHKHLSFKIA